MLVMRIKTPVKYAVESVVVEGKFAMLSAESYGLYYRMTAATPVK